MDNLSENPNNPNNPYSDFPPENRPPVNTAYVCKRCGRVLSAGEPVYRNLIPHNYGGRVSYTQDGVLCLSCVREKELEWQAAEYASYLAADDVRRAKNRLCCGCESCCCGGCCHDLCDCLIFPCDCFCDILRCCLIIFFLPLAFFWFLGQGIMAAAAFGASRIRDLARAFVRRPRRENV